MSKILNLVENHCKKHNIKFTTTTNTHIQYPESNLPCTGYFTLKNNIPELGITTSHKTWELILLHEYCHSLQWLENSEIWKNAFLTEEETKRFNFCDGSEAVDVIDLWTEFKVELSQYDVNNFVNRAVDMERDCEFRTCELAKDLVDNFDNDKYIQLSNTYLRFYKFVEKNRRWGVPGIPSYYDEYVVSKQNKTFNINYFSPLSKFEEDIFWDFINKYEVK